MTFSRIKNVPILLLILVLSCHSSYADVRIISYNIKDFWLRFDGEPGIIAKEGDEIGKDEIEKLEIVAGVINREKPDFIGILECASPAELLFLCCGRNMTCVFEFVERLD